jgi:hypothetical protein
VIILLTLQFVGDNFYEHIHTKKKIIFMNIYIPKRTVKEYLAEVSLKPKAKWLAEVRDTDGTIRPAFNGEWFDNLFLNTFRDSFFNNGFSVVGNNNGQNAKGSLLSMFFGNSNQNYIYWTTRMSVGGSSTPATVTQTGLQAYIKDSNAVYPTGNTASMNPTNGDAVFTLKQQFAIEIGTITYKEACLKISNTLNGGGNTILGIANYSSLNLNRVVFPAGLTLTVGQQLILTCAITMPTAAVTPIPVTLAAQNGVNISGNLQLVGTSSSILGGVVGANGIITSDDVTLPLLPDTASSTRFSTLPFLGLTTASSFPSYNSNTTGMQTNSVAGVWSTYTNGTGFMDLTANWGLGNPASDTAFRSICVGTTSGVNGYQLLLANQMTKQASAMLSIAFRFSLS